MLAPRPPLPKRDKTVPSAGSAVAVSLPILGQRPSDLGEVPLGDCFTLAVLTGGVEAQPLVEGFRVMLTRVAMSGIV